MLESISVGFTYRFVCELKHTCVHLLIPLFLSCKLVKIISNFFQAPLSLSEKQLTLGQMHELLLKRRARASPALDTNAATHLIRSALGTGEYGELSQERLASMLALPEDLARLYRDDITVTVVYLNSDLARPPHC